MALSNDPGGHGEVSNLSLLRESNVSFFLLFRFKLNF